MAGDPQYAADLKSGITDIMNEVGSTVTFNSNAQGAWIDSNDKTKGKTITTTSTTAVGVVYDYKKKDIDGTIIQAGDRCCLIDYSLLTTIPALSDTCTIGGTTYKIINIETISLSDTTVTLLFQLRE